MSQNKKIVIAADIFPPDIGGPATYSLKLAEELIGKGWQVKLICYSDEKQNDNYSFTVFRVVRSRIKLWHYFKYYLKLKSIASDCDVIYAMGPVSAGYPALKVAKKLNKKFVNKVVGDYAWEYARNNGLTKLGIDDFQKTGFTGRVDQLKKIESKVCRSADLVITPSKYLKSIVVGWGATDEQVQVVYNAIIAPEIERKQSDDDLLVSIGRLVSWKGFEVLIKIVPELLVINPNFKLMILGSGPDEQKLQDLVEGLNLKDKIEIKRVEPKERDQILSKTMAFVLNTGYEGLPHTVLEAMTAGVPVITTDLCGNPEIVENGKTGLLVEYNNREQLKEAILKLYNNPELGKQFVDNAKKGLDKFKFEEMINNTEKILKEV